MVARPLYAIGGLLIAAGVDLLVNLLASALQERAFNDQFTDQAIWWFAGLALTGLVIGYWLGTCIQLPSGSGPQVPSAGPSQTSGTQQQDGKLIVTRLKALLSYGKLRGQGINLSDVLLIGSKLDIDTHE